MAIARRIPMTTPPDRTPDPTNPTNRIDDGPSSDTLAAKRAKAEDEAKAGLLQHVPDSYTVRTDTGDGEDPPSDRGSPPQIR